MSTAKDNQVKRIQEVVRETVPDALCRHGIEGDVVCSVSVGTAIEVRFDLNGPSDADLGWYAQRLKDKVAKARAAAALRSASGVE